MELSTKVLFFLKQVTAFMHRQTIFFTKPAESIKSIYRQLINQIRV